MYYVDSSSFNIKQANGQSDSLIIIICLKEQEFMYNSNSLDDSAYDSTVAYMMADM